MEMTTMQIDRATVEQALEALEWHYRQGHSNTIGGLRLKIDEKALRNLKAALAQQDEPKGGGNLPPPLPAEPEPVARECSDPMCACRGGPCAECEEGQREKEIKDLRSSLDFYQRRCEALQSWQSKMRDPERTIVCDILANGFTLDPAFAGNRYTAPPQRPTEPVQEPVAWRCACGANLYIDENGAPRSKA